MKFVEKISKQIILNNPIKNPISNNNKCLMRDYISYLLYDSNNSYYGNNNILPIGKLENPINYSEIEGIHTYNDTLADVYPKSTWLTASELLRPFYGYSLANYILKKEKNENRNTDINIVEIGFGMGGTIESILDFYKKFDIETYKRVNIVGFENNLTMFNKVEETLQKNHKDLFENNQIKLVNGNYNGLENPISDNCYLLGINLLDSLPHDKIIIKKQAKKLLTNDISYFLNSISNEFDSSIDKKINDYLEEFTNNLIQLKIVKQTIINNENNNRSEELEDVSDKDIIESLYYYILEAAQVNHYLFDQKSQKIEDSRIFNNKDWFISMFQSLQKYFMSSDNVWLPSQLPNFLRSINKDFPNHNLIIHDFDFLPNPLQTDYKGVNSPIIYSIKENSSDSIFHKRLLEPSIKNLPLNVYFPVDFSHLKIAYRLISNKTGSIQKYKYFMKENAYEEWTRTKTNFSPLFETNLNTSFFLS